MMMMKLRGLEKRCELHQYGLGQSVSRNRIWCIIFI